MVIKKWLERTVNALLHRFGYTICKIGLEETEAKLSIGGLYSRVMPSNQNAVDIFKGSWSSEFPPEYDLNAGTIQLFNDSRVRWAADRVGGVQGKTVLELGPLEGGHSYMLEQMGASKIVAVEANVKSYLKCLVVKEITGLKRVEFRFGDFLPLLQAGKETYDVIFASGVLYHMEYPLEFIAGLSRCSSAVFVWTHYYDEQLVLRARNRRFKPSSYSCEGFHTTVYRQDYDQAAYDCAFCGGSRPFSYWLERDEIIRCFRHFGFSHIELNFDQPDHMSGPALALVVRK